MRAIIILAMFAVSLANAAWNDYEEVRELELASDGIDLLEIDAGARHAGDRLLRARVDERGEALGRLVPLATDVATHCLHGDPASLLQLVHWAGQRSGPAREGVH